MCVRKVEDYSVGLEVDEMSVCLCVCMCVRRGGEECGRSRRNVMYVCVCVSMCEG